MFNKIWKTIVSVLYPDVLALGVIGLLIDLIFKSPHSLSELVVLNFISAFIIVSVFEYVAMKWKETK